MAKLFANIGDPDQTPHSDLMWHLIWVCSVCQVPFYRFADYNGLMIHDRIIELGEAECHTRMTTHAFCFPVISPFKLTFLFSVYN